MFLPDVATYRKDFDETEYISLIKGWIIRKIQWIWGKVKNSLRKDFDNEPIYNEKYLRAKIKSYNGKINTNFHNNKILEEGSQYICSSIILNDSVFRTGKKHYPQGLLEECKYITKEKTFPKYIVDDIEISSDFDRENSNEENSYQKNSDKENSNEQNFDEENLKNTNITIKI